MSRTTAKNAWVAAERKAWRTARLRALARRRRKVAASSLHLPPTSINMTTRRQRLPCTSSGYVRSLARRAACRAASSTRRSVSGSTAASSPKGAGESGCWEGEPVGRVELQEVWVNGLVLWGWAPARVLQLVQSALSPWGQPFGCEGLAGGTQLPMADEFTPNSLRAVDVVWSFLLSKLGDVGAKRPAPSFASLRPTGPAWTSPGPAVFPPPNPP